MMTFDDIRKNGLLIYEYVRGSVSHGTNTPTSDVDTGGVYMCPPDQLLGLGIDYQDQVSDKKGDNVWFELNKFMSLLMKSNPTVLEALFVDDENVLYEHPIMTEIKKHRDMFVTKQCFAPFFGYASSQISKARGLKKKISNPIVERKGVLDYCYVPYGQGSMKVGEWLEMRGLKQKYCGLSDMPNMHDTYGLYYDWGTHLICEYGADLKDKTNLADVWDKLCHEGDEFEYGHGTCSFTDSLTEYGLNFSEHLAYAKQLRHVEPFGFSGIVSETGDSNDVRVCAVPKNLRPLTVMTYNRSGYESHCRDYKEYKEWESKRNPVRYESNLGKNYDAKNMSECFRMVNMAIEIAKGEGVKVNRRGIDSGFLLDVKSHKYEYDELMKMLEEKRAQMNEAQATSVIPDAIDPRKVNDLLVSIRRSQITSSFD